MSNYIPKFLIFGLMVPFFATFPATALSNAGSNQKATVLFSAKALTDIKASFFFNCKDSDKAVFKTALDKLPLFNRLARSNPFDIDNFKELVENAPRFSGSSWHEEILGKILVASIFHNCQVDVAMETWRILQKIRIENSDLKIPDCSSTLTIGSELADQDNVKIPLLKKHLPGFAIAALKNGFFPKAREAIERILIYDGKAGLGAEYDLIDLSQSSPRPSPDQWLNYSTGNVATISLFIFEKTKAPENETRLGVFQQAIIPKSFKCFLNDKILITEDIVDHLEKVSLTGKIVSINPDISNKVGVMLLLTRGKKHANDNISIFANIDNSKLFGCLLAVHNGQCRLIDDPESLDVFNLILKSSGVLKYLSSNHYIHRKIFNTITLKNKNSHNVTNFTDCYGLGRVESLFIYQASAADIEPIEYEGLRWASIATDTPVYSFSWMKARHGAENEIPETGAKMLEISKKVRSRLGELAGRLPDGCHVQGITGDESINREPPEERWLRAWSIRQGLPVGNELRKLLRLYKIIGAPLPDRISLRMPLLFRANFVNPRRPAGEYDMVSGYWFEELELMIIADFDCDSGQAIGNLAATALGIPAKINIAKPLAADRALANSTASESINASASSGINTETTKTGNESKNPSENASSHQSVKTSDATAQPFKIVLYDGFNFKNHGLRLALHQDSQGLPEIEKILQQHQINPSDESIMFDDADSYQTFASISDKVCFFICEKGKQPQLRWAEEPEK